MRQGTVPCTNTEIGTSLQYNMFAYCENDPVNYDDPTGEYSPAKAYYYARKHWCYYNKSFPCFNSAGGDCTNFVSQCLYFGGNKMDSFWYCYKYKKYNKYRNYWNISNAWKNNKYLLPYLYASNHVAKYRVIYSNKNLKVVQDNIEKTLKNFPTTKCSFLILFCENGIPYHSAINGYIAQDCRDIDYFAHTSAQNGDDKKHTLKTFFKEHKSNKYSVKLIAIK